MTESTAEVKNGQAWRHLLMYSAEKSFLFNEARASKPKNPDERSERAQRMEKESGKLAIVKYDLSRKEKGIIGIPVELEVRGDQDNLQAIRGRVRSYSLQARTLTISSSGRLVTEQFCEIGYEGIPGGVPMLVRTPLIEIRTETPCDR